jgi:hypothetical protein
MDAPNDRFAAAARAVADAHFQKGLCSPDWVAVVWSVPASPGGLVQAELYLRDPFLASLRDPQAPTVARSLLEPLEGEPRRFAVVVMDGLAFHLYFFAWAQGDRN